MSYPHNLDFQPSTLRADDKPFAIKPVWMKHAAAVETGAGLTWFPKGVQFGFGVLPIWFDLVGTGDTHSFWICKLNRMREMN